MTIEFPPLEKWEWESGKDKNDRPYMECDVMDLFDFDLDEMQDYRNQDEETITSVTVRKYQSNYILAYITESGDDGVDADDTYSISYINIWKRVPVHLFYRNYQQIMNEFREEVYKQFIGEDAYELLKSLKKSDDDDDELLTPLDIDPLEEFKLDNPPDDFCTKEEVDAVLRLNPMELHNFRIFMYNSHNIRNPEHRKMVFKLVADIIIRQNMQLQQLKTQEEREHFVENVMVDSQAVAVACYIKWGHRFPLSAHDAMKFIKPYLVTKPDPPKELTRLEKIKASEPDLDMWR